MALFLWTGPLIYLMYIPQCDVCLTSTFWMKTGKKVNVDVNVMLQLVKLTFNFYFYTCFHLFQNVFIYPIYINIYRLFLTLLFA